MVGAGRGAAKESAKLDLVSCYTRTPEKRAAFAEAHGCAEAGSYEAILADPAIEGVLITSTTASTGRRSRPPSGPGSTSGWRSRSRTPWPRRGPSSRPGARRERSSRWGTATAGGGPPKMKALIEDGTVGRPLQAEAFWSTSSGLQLTPDKWRYFREECPGGALIQLGVPPRRPCTTCSGTRCGSWDAPQARHPRPEIDDVTATIVEHARGAVSSLACGFCTPGVFSLRLHGTGGVLYLEMHRTDVTRVERTDEETVLTLQRPGESVWGAGSRSPTCPTWCTARSRSSPCACARGRPPRPARARAALALAVVEGSAISSEKGVAVEVEELLDGMEI